MDNVKFFIVSLSDSRTVETDYSTVVLERLILNYNKSAFIKTALIKDCFYFLWQKLCFAVFGFKADFVFILGSSGFYKRDIAFYVLDKFLTKKNYNLYYHLLFKASKITKKFNSDFVFLSCGMCGVTWNSFLINFPGGVEGAREMWFALLPLLGHIYKIINFNKHA